MSTHDAWKHYKLFNEKMKMQISGDQKFLQNHSILHHFRDKCIFAFCAEIQDAYKNDAKNNFWEKSPVDSTDTLGVKTFDKIVLSLTVFKINAFMCFTQKFKMASKKWWENDLWEMSQVDSADTLEGQKF